MPRRAPGQDREQLVIRCGRCSRRCQPDLHGNYNLARDIRSRTIAARPYLTKSARLPTPENGPLEVSVLRNAGQGPALNARWCRASVAGIQVSSRFDLAPGQEIGLLLDALLGQGRDDVLNKSFDTLKGVPIMELERENANVIGTTALARSEHSGKEGPEEVIVCEDYLGRALQVLDQPAARCCGNLDASNLAPQATSLDSVAKRHRKGWTLGQNVHMNRRSPLSSPAKLDAAFFHLYGIERDDVHYIMETFPIVKRKDEARFGSYRTKDTILDTYDAMHRAMDKGDPYQTILEPPPADPSVAHTVLPPVRSESAG
jgi:hypothetical protein